MDGKRKLLLIIVGLFIGYIVVSALVTRLLFGFYDNTHADINLYRLPLIRPYEFRAVDVLEGKGWRVPAEDTDSEFHYEGFFLKSPGVDSVTINGNSILFYSSSESITGISGRQPVWFIFDTNKKKGEYFLNEHEFYNYIKNNYSINKVKFYDPVVLFKEFENSGKLPPEWDSLVLADKKEWWKRLFY